MRDRPEISDADIIAAVRKGDAEMFGVLFDRWLDRVHDVARNIVRDGDTAADVAQDAFISAWQQLDRLDDPDAFGGWLLRITRNRALDRLQRDQRSRPQEDHVVTRQHDAGAPDPMGTRRRDDPADIASDLERDDLVHAAAVALGVRDASLLDLHLRHGLGAAEIAKETGASANSVHQQLFRMRDRLGNAIGALLLWQRGRPTCDRLGNLVSDGAEFDAEVFGVVERHRRGCDDCSKRRAGMVVPEALFSALPVVVVPLALKGAIKQGVVASGVPLESSAAVSEAQSDGTESHVPPGEGVEADGSASSVASSGVHRFTPRRFLIAAAILALVSAGIAGVASSRRSSDQLSGSLADIEAPESTDDGSNGDSITVAGSERPASTEQTSTSEQIPTSSEQTTSITALAAPIPGTDAPAAQAQGSTTIPLAPNPPASTAPQPPSPVVVVATTQPPPTVAPPTTTLPPPAFTTTTAPPVSPIVTSFTAKAGPGVLLCGSPSQSPRTFEWTSVNATSATLTIAGVSRTVPTSGTIPACGASGDFAVLEAQSPGGTAQRSMTLP